MEFGLSHVIIALIAFALGWTLRRKPNAVATEAATAELGPLEEGASRRPLTGERVFMLIFLSGWLIAWSAGCWMALKAVLGGSSSLFLFGWLIAALAGWVYAAHTIFCLVTGRPIKGRGGKDI